MVINTLEKYSVKIQERQTKKKCIFTLLLIACFYLWKKYHEITLLKKKYPKKVINLFGPFDHLRHVCSN